MNNNLDQGNMSFMHLCWSNSTWLEKKMKKNTA